jgi:hypothetical protein
MGRKPEVVYTDDEGALNSKEIQGYFKHENIKHIVSRGHAPVAERAIRTFKALLYKIVESGESAQWHVAVPKALTLYNYKMASESYKHDTERCATEQKRVGCQIAHGIA